MRDLGPASVVVGANGNAASLAAVRLAAREATARATALRILHAFTWPGSARTGTPAAYGDARQDAVRMVQNAVDVARRGTPGIHVHGQVVDGPPGRVLIAATRAAQLLVLGGTPVATVPRPPIDSVLLQAVSQAWCPVVVTRGLRPPTGPLIAAIDGSGAALLALRHAAAEAARRVLPVEVVHVVEDSGRAAHQTGEAVLAAAVAAVPELRDVRTWLISGDPAQTLIRVSRRARMLIVGPRGLGGAALLGPVAQELLRRCACPTVFVHRATPDDQCLASAQPPAVAPACT